MNTSDTNFCAKQYKSGSLHVAHCLLSWDTASELWSVFIFSGLAKTKPRAKWLFKTLFVFYSCQWKSFWGTKGDESLWSGSMCLHTTWQSLLPGSGHLNNIHCLFDSLFRHLFVHSLHPLFPQPWHQFLSCYLSLCLGSEALCCGSLQ